MSPLIADPPRPRTARPSAADSWKMKDIEADHDSGMKAITCSDFKPISFGH